MNLSQVDLHFLKMARLQGEQRPDAIETKSKQHGSGPHHRGAVIAQGDKLLSTGFSTHLGGNLYKPQTEERYVATINAELVAIGNLTQKGCPPLTTTTIYISDCPNWYTFKMLITLGIRRIVHYGPVLNERITHYAQELNIQIISVG
jgi:deoxycytidylate deaminase